MADGMGLKLPLMRHAYISQLEALVAKLEEDKCTSIEICRAATKDEAQAAKA